MRDKEVVLTGLILILLSPLIGTLLFYIYSNIIGFFISSDMSVNMIWFSCILSVDIIGIVIANNARKCRE